MIAWHKSFAPSHPAASAQPPAAQPSNTQPRNITTEQTIPLFSEQDFPPLRSSVSLPQPPVMSTAPNTSVVAPTGTLSTEASTSQQARDNSVTETSAPGPARTTQATSVSHHPMLTRSKAGITKPNPRYALMTSKVAYPEPKTVTEALKDKRWCDPMSEEINNCHETGTWELVQQNDAATISSSSVSTCTQNKVSLETKQNVALASVKAKASQATTHAIPTANRFQVLNDELLQTS
ncbi:hypothetical protein YC2023_077530 [Brassica napus]